MPVKFAMRGQDKLENFLQQIPHGTKQAALPAASEYLIGNDAHGLKHYPPKQGQKYERTYTLQGGWQVVGDTYRQRIINNVDYAPHVPNRWGHYGWRQWADVIASNMTGAIRAAQAEVNRWLKANG